MSCGVSLRYSLDLALLWLGCRLAAIAPIQPLDWVLPYATDVALKKQKNKTNKKKSIDLICGLTYGLSYKMSYEHLRRIGMLLLLVEYSV